uniref:SREBP regulating gene protein n=1 Tax=Rhinopithecus bieti TaxID=61621 RepID=A0A2K6JM97_RHIBE
MVNLAAMVWRRLLRKKWVLAPVFGLRLSTSSAAPPRMGIPLQVQDHDQPIPWKVSRPSNQCRNSIQGKHLITDELSYICERKDLLVNGCCNVNVSSTKQYCWDGCCKQLLLEHFLNRAAVAFQNLSMAVKDHLELCLVKSRTSSQSLQHENTDWDPTAKYCYGESLPELFPA